MCTALAASRGCVADSECKGDRICDAGTCQAPSAAIQAPHPGQTTPLHESGEPLVRGWGRAGGAIGLATSIPALLLAIGSDVTREDQIPSLPIGVTATVLIATGVPIAFSGAKSARRGAKVTGGTGLIITSWVFYGLSMSNAIGLIGMGVSEIQPPAGVISLTGILGLTSGVTMAIAAFAADNQARTKIEASRQARGPKPQMSLGVVPLSHGSRTVGASFGVAAQF